MKAQMNVSFVETNYILKNIVIVINVFFLIILHFTPGIPYLSNKLNCIHLTWQFGIRSQI